MHGVCSLRVLEHELHQKALVKVLYRMKYMLRVTRSVYEGHIDVPETGSTLI
jgi:hypothetical protein